MLFQLEIAPQTAFGSEILGETLFGQFCWAARSLYGEKQLSDWLEGYTEGNPFIVISDAFPHGYLPLPTLPSFVWEADPNQDRKSLKAKRWIEREQTKVLALAKWQKVALANKEIPGLKGSVMSIRIPQMHNTISRETSTTGTGQFAPYMASQTWFDENLHLDVYVVVDERITKEQVQECFQYIGLTGFGRDASIGLGKFDLIKINSIDTNTETKTYLTLSSCSLCGMDLEEQSYYKVKTHFGRHGNQLAHSTNPFKKPLLLAERSAVLTLKTAQSVQFLGQGIGGVSYIQPQAVHQGYAPVIPIMNLA